MRAYISITQASELLTSDGCKLEEDVQQAPPLRRSHLCIVYCHGLVGKFPPQPPRRPAPPTAGPRASWQRLAKHSQSRMPHPLSSSTCSAPGVSLLTLCIPCHIVSLCRLKHMIQMSKTHSIAPRKFNAVASEHINLPALACSIPACLHYLAEFHLRQVTGQ